MTARWLLSSLLGAVGAMSLGVSAARADVAPGSVIDKTNADQVQDLVSPGVMWCIQRGMNIKIVPYKKVEWNPAYKEATEKYSGQVKLSADGRTLENYVAGLPFPNIDPNDPDVAHQDHVELRVQAVRDRRPGPAQLRRRHRHGLGQTARWLERHFLLDHLRRLFYTGAPLSSTRSRCCCPTATACGKASLHPILEPFDLKGVGLTSNRYLDPDRQDDTWLYLPTLRRVRRLSSAQRSDALFGQDTDVDSYDGYAGQIAWFNWKFLGEKKMLGPSTPRTSRPSTAGRRRLRLLRQLGEARSVGGRGRLEAGPVRLWKRVLFIDKETYFIAYSDIYDKAGQLWKVWLNSTFRNKAAPGLRGQYDCDMPFAPASPWSTSQLSHATRAALPSAKFPGEQGWYFNQGAKTGLTEEFFTIAHMIEASH